MRHFAAAILFCLVLLATEGHGIRCWRRQFACADGKQCIPASRFCDGRIHCRDQSDERRAWKFSKGLRCQKNRRTCLLDISYTNKMDIFCDKPTKPVTGMRCARDEFACNDGSKCVKMSDFCDGRKDCRDGSDETLRGQKYNDTERPCRKGGNVCVLPESLRSKRHILCDKDTICWDDEFKCETGNKCVPWHWFCDGSSDCADGSDEISVQRELDGIACNRGRNTCLLPETYNAELFCNREVTCLDGEFKCLDGTQCVPWNKFCSGQPECRDGSDEHGAHSGVVGTFCRRGRHVCVMPEGNEGMQEKLCLPDPECTSEEYSCLDGTKCIPWRQFCDGMGTCKDKSDEININSTLPGFKCRRGNFLCTLPEQYYYKAEEICDGEPKCKDDEYPCLSGTQCIKKTRFCDGSFDCRDLSDEIRAKDSNSGIPCKKGKRFCVLPNERATLRNDLCAADRSCISGFQCADRTQCIPKEWFCDGVVHCRDGSDEMSSFNRFKKRNYGVQCRGQKDTCLLPVEQAYKRNTICRSQKKLVCKPDEFMCRDGSECLKASWFCDGEAYCGDDSDAVVSKMTMKKDDIRCRHEEFVCVLPIGQREKKDALCKRDPMCDKDEYACLDGSRCLPGKYFCDGYKDCVDGSDEISPFTETSGSTCRGNRNSWIYFGGNDGVAGGNWCVLPESQTSKKKWLCNN